MKHIDFPIRPHLLKYLQVHLRLTVVEEAPLQLSDFVLAIGNKRFGLPLIHLLSKSVKSWRHEDSNADCTSVLGIDLRNYKGLHYDLECGRISAYAVFEYNELIDELFREELYWWVRQHYARRATIKDAILSFMAFYSVTEGDILFETLRKDVQRNAELPARNKKAEKGKKAKNFPADVSQKIGDLSRKKVQVSRKIGVLSHKDAYESVKEQLMKLPLPLFETEFFYRNAAA